MIERWDIKEVTGINYPYPNSNYLYVNFCFAALDRRSPTTRFREMISSADYYPSWVDSGCLKRVVLLKRPQQ